MQIARRRGPRMSPGAGPSGSTGAREAGRRRRSVAALLLLQLTLLLTPAALLQPGEASPIVEAILAQVVPFASDQLAATAALGLAADTFPNSTNFATGQWDTTDASTWTAGEH
jgi:hypothetical protein